MPRRCGQPWLSLLALCHGHAGLVLRWPWSSSLFMGSPTSSIAKGQGEAPSKPLFLEANDLAEPRAMGGEPGRSGRALLFGWDGTCQGSGGDVPRCPGELPGPEAELPFPCRERGSKEWDGGGALPRALPPHQEAEDQPLQQQQGAASGRGPDPR